MSPSPAVLAVLGLYNGMQNDRINEYAASGPSSLKWLNNRFYLIFGQSHSKQCSFLHDDDPGRKRRCASCQTTNFNIYQKRYPELFAKRFSILETRDSQLVITLSLQLRKILLVDKLLPNTGTGKPPPASDEPETTIVDMILPDVEVVCCLIHSMIILAITGKCRGKLWRKFGYGPNLEMLGTSSRTNLNTGQTRVRGE